MSSHIPVTLTAAQFSRISSSWSTCSISFSTFPLLLLCPPPPRTAQQTELDMSASFGFLEHQDPAMEPITPQMLMIVASWLSEVAFEFSMQQETLFLAVSLLARFLDGSTVSCCALVRCALSCVHISMHRTASLRPFALHTLV